MTMTDNADTKIFAIVADAIDRLLTRPEVRNMLDTESSEAALALLEQAMRMRLYLNKGDDSMVTVLAAYALIRAWQDRQQAKRDAGQKAVVA